MSLRGRLWLVIALAAVTLAIAVLAVVHALNSTDAARIQSADAGMAATASALAGAFAELHTPSLGTLEPELLRQRSLAAIAAAPPDTQAGYCSRTGEIYLAVGRGRNGEFQPAPKPLPPDQHAAVSEACRGGRAREALKHPSDSILISAVPVAEGSAWVLRRIESRDNDDPWTLYLVSLAAATTVLVGVTLTTMLALGRGMQHLRGVVLQLGADLRARVVAPKQPEFARLTEALVEMSAHLAEAAERERGLQSALAHRERLAGLGRVVAGAAHEIRNPLAGLKLRLDVMARAPDLSDVAGEDVRACLAEVARLDRVVQSLLVVSRKSDTAVQRQDVAGLVAERVRALAGPGGASGPRIELERRGATDAVVDRDALTRVLDNLLRNAAEASAPDGAVKVSLVGGPRMIEIDVSDRGKGVPDALREKLFEPFFTTKPEGTGLGLWLSRALVEANGGTLDYEPTGDESRFRIRLPREERA